MCIRDRRESSLGWREVHFGGAVQGADVLFVRGATNQQFFANHAAQMAWNIRIRATLTARLLDGDTIDPHRCLFINPSIRGLEGALAQCAQPEWTDESTGGKLRVDKQPRAVGQSRPPSPDCYDGILLAFRADTRRGLRRPS